MPVTPQKSHFKNYVKFSPDVELKYIFHKNYLTFETKHPKKMFPEKRNKERSSVIICSFDKSYLLDFTLKDLFLKTRTKFLKIHILCAHFKSISINK
jgi:hypothetical protein